MCCCCNEKEPLPHCMKNLHYVEIKIDRQKIVINSTITENSPVFSPAYCEPNVDKIIQDVILVKNSDNPLREFSVNTTSLHYSE